MSKGTAPIDIYASTNVNLIIEGNNSIRVPQYYPAIGFYGDDATNTLTLSSGNKRISLRFKWWYRCCSNRWKC